jgi:hypothetical protein
MNTRARFSARPGWGHLGIVTTTLLLTSSALAAQRQTYRVELSGAAGLHQFDPKTELAGSAGFAGRLGYWIYGPVSIEGELDYARPHTNTAIRQSINTTTYAGWLLLNARVGANNSVFLRGGYGSTTYGRCPAISVPGTGPCGSAGVLQGGIGARLGLTRTLLLRTDLTANRSLTTLKFSNLTFQGGLSLMLGATGSDSDQDGVPDSKDHCPNTARGTTVDRRGCTLDADKDGVGDRFDRCPNTPAGQPVDISGCPSDGDRDGVPDGLDQCSDTPRNAQVDARGCPVAVVPPAVTPPAPQPKPQPKDTVVRQPLARDTTPARRDTMPVKRDTAPAKPAPIPAPGNPAPVNPRPPVPSASSSAPAAPTAGKAGDRSWVVPGTAWTYRAAILEPSAFPVLDSVAAVLKADPEARVEIVGHAFDQLIPADDLKLSQYRAEAVRSYLTFNGVPVSRITAVGRGSRPLIDRGTTEEARARNRRIEIRITHPGK